MDAENGPLGLIRCKRATETSLAGNSEGETRKIRIGTYEELPRGNVVWIKEANEEAIQLANKIVNQQDPISFHEMRMTNEEYWTLLRLRSQCQIYPVNTGMMNLTDDEYMTAILAG